MLGPQPHENTRGNFTQLKVRFVGFSSQEVLFQRVLVGTVCSGPHGYLLYSEAMSDVWQQTNGRLELTHDRTPSQS